MRRYLKYLINIPIIAAIVGSVAIYNYTLGVRERHAIHQEIMGRMMATPHAKELKPVTWDGVSSGELSEKAGEQVVLVGYGFPLNENYVRDLGSVGQIGGMDPCCDKPITYKNVTGLSLSPLPYHTYFWKKAPVTVTVDMANQQPVEFMADSPSYFRGTLDLREEGGRTVLALRDAERIDTSKGSAFGAVNSDKSPPIAANVASTQ